MKSADKKGIFDVMIAFVRGKLAETEPDAALIETAAGIGFRVIMPARELEMLPRTGEEVLVYTWLQVREDGLSLFGFLHREDLAMFEQLIGVNGVGPKAAVSLLSAVPADDLRFAILAEDTKAIAKAPGIGVKTAKKIILELKDKLDLEEAVEWKDSHTSEASVRGSMSGAEEEALLALETLGIGSTDALRAVRSVKGADEMSSEEILKAALKQIR